MTFGRLWTRLFIKLFLIVTIRAVYCSFSQISCTVFQLLNQILIILSNCTRTYSYCIFLKAKFSGMLSKISLQVQMLHFCFIRIYNDVVNASFRQGKWKLLCLNLCVIVVWMSNQHALHRDESSLWCCVCNWRASVWIQWCRVCTGRLYSSISQLCLVCLDLCCIAHPQT